MLRERNIDFSKLEYPAFCGLPVVKERDLPDGIDSARARLIRVNEKKWVNGTLLTYYFFDKDSDGEYVHYTDGTREWKTWQASEEEKDVVREAFAAWKNIGIGLEFEEVDNRQDALIRIGFMQGNGSWSYVGRDIWGKPQDRRTMNFGWPLTRGAHGIDTALHEIGHTLGFPHEHQNPIAGIVWDEAKVISSLAGAPNYWDEAKARHNVLRKIDPDSVQGSNVDENSIMMYPLPAEWILGPQHLTDGIDPAPGLSERDKEWVKTFYPPIDHRTDISLKPFESRLLDIEPGEQLNFEFVPDETRDYQISTFGRIDTVMVLYEIVDGKEVYLSGDDDSGQDLNSQIKRRFIKDRKYIVRLRLYSKYKSGVGAVMAW